MLPIRSITVRTIDRHGTPVAKAAVRIQAHSNPDYEFPGAQWDALANDRVLVGHTDDEGNTWITGRAKDTIVLAGGENVEPEPIETVIKTSRFVDQAVCLGQDQRGLGALLVPNLEALEHEVPRSEWDVRDGEMNGSAVQKLMRRELDRLLVRENGVRACDRVTTFRVLAEPMTPENGLLTQTLKVRRHVVAERHRALIATMFA